MGLSVERGRQGWAVWAALTDGQRLELGEYPHARAVNLMCLLMTGQHQAAHPLLRAAPAAIAALAAWGVTAVLP